MITVDHASRTYPGGVQALRDVSLTVGGGEMLAIVGPSGSGKSTLLHLMGTLDKPTTGTVEIDGNDISTLSDNALSALRARTIGFVFQQFFLTEGLSAIENVASDSSTPEFRVRRDGRWRCPLWTESVSSTARCTGRTSCPVVNASGSRSRGPW